MKIQLVIIILFPCLLSAQVNLEQATINGVNYVSTNMKIGQEHVDPLIVNNISWVAVIPYAFVPDKTKPDLVFDSKWQWTGEKVDGIRHSVKLLKQAGVHVMIKPQIWVAMGEYTGEIKMTNDLDWTSLEEAYTSYILEFAHIAEEFNVELLCIGTELEKFVHNRPTYWLELISQVREVYSGKITYAENWDCFDKVPFFGEMDFIGIDAYFPLKVRGTLSRRKLKIAWEDHVQLIDSVSKRINKPILFTEFGYRSVKGASKEPWEYGESEKLSMNEQKLALEVLFETFWCRDWFAGGFLWKWWPVHDENGGEYDAGFTVQNKSAQDVVSDFYLRHTNCCYKHVEQFTDAR